MLHDSYHLDTVIVDVDEPSRPRVASEELTVQVMTGGTWHRRRRDLAMTACGLTYHSQFAPVRRENDAGPLCVKCHTDYELAQSEKLAKTDNEGTR
jgi:hypothetical protein